MTNYDNDILKRNIKRLMENNNINQQQLGDALGMSQSNVSKALSENDKKRFTLDQVVGIAKYFKVSIDSLIGKTDTQSYDLSLRTIAIYLVELISDEDVIIFDHPVEEKIFDNWEPSEPECTAKNETVHYNAFYFPSYWYPNDSPDRDDDYLKILSLGNRTRQHPLNTFLNQFLQIYRIYKAEGLDTETYHTIIKDLLNHLP